MFHITKVAWNVKSNSINFADRKTNFIGWKMLRFSITYKIGHISDKIETYNIIVMVYFCPKRSNFVFIK